MTSNLFIIVLNQETIYKIYAVMIQCLLVRCISSSKQSSCSSSIESFNFLASKKIMSSNSGTSISSSMSITMLSTSDVLFHSFNFFWRRWPNAEKTVQGHHTVHKYHICLFLFSFDYTHILNPNEYSQKTFSRSR